MQAGAESRQRGVHVEVFTIERETVTEVGLTETSASAPSSIAYVEASIHRPSSRVEMLDAPVGVLAQLAEKIVEVEGPVHIDEVIVRLRSAWGLLRTGPRIQAAGERAIAASVGAGRMTQDDRFLSLPGAEAHVRDRSAVSSATLRRKCAASRNSGGDRDREAELRGAARGDRPNGLALVRLSVDQRAAAGGDPGAGSRAHVTGATGGQGRSGHRWRGDSGRLSFAPLSRLSFSSLIGPPSGFRLR